MLASLLLSVLLTMLCSVSPLPAAGPYELVRIPDAFTPGGIAPDGVAGQPLAAGLHNNSNRAGRFRLTTSAIEVIDTLVDPNRFSFGRGACGEFSVGAFGLGSDQSQTTGFLWSPRTGLEGRRGPGAVSVVTSVTCEGTAVGHGTPSGGGALLPLRWAPEGTVEVLAVLATGRDASVEAINASGAMTGYSGLSTGTLVCAVWDSAGTAQTCLPTGDASQGTGINASGAVSGFVATPQGLRGVVREASGTVQMLPPLPGHTGSRANGLNDAGVVVGRSFRGQGAQAKGVLWEGGAVVEVLTLVTNPAGWTLENCVGVSNAGVLLCSGMQEGLFASAFAVPVAPPPDRHPAPPPPRHRRR